MKIKKSRLVEIIREEIEEAKLRQSIRGVIREFTTTGTAAGAKKSGHKSADTKSKESTYDTKSADYDTKSAAVDASKQYKSLHKSGPTVYASTNTAIRGAGYGPWVTNPDYTSQVSARDTAETAKDSAKSTLDTETEADLQAEVPTQKPPAGGGAGFGKGKSAGTAKGKKKK